MSDNRAMDSIKHEGGRFFVEREGRMVAELTYRMQGEDAAVDHTFVDPSARGGTLARDLVEAAVKWARGESRKIIPLCPYVQAVFAKTPAYADVAKAG